MYELIDKISAIREIQSYLRYISDKIDDRIPTISIDGIYGNETEKAVKTYQRLYGLVESGIVNFETFKSLFELSNDYRINQNRQKYIVNSGSLPMKLNDINSDVVNLNTLINMLRGYYIEIPRIENTSFYSRQTESAIKEIQKIFGYKVNGIVERKLYERILDEISSLNRDNLINLR